MKNQTCENCGSKNKIVTNWSSGDKLCSNCGIVIDQSIFSNETPEYRVFRDDEKSENKIRVGKAYSIFEHMNICAKEEIDEKQYYTKGLHMMDEFFARYFVDGRNKAIENRAIEIFDYAFRCQRGEKEGIQIYKKNNEKLDEKNTKNKKRKKYSKKKTYLVTAIWVAFIESGANENQWSITNISRFFETDISENRVRKCLKFLNLNMEQVRRGGRKKRKQQNSTRKFSRWKKICSAQNKK